MKKFLDRVSVCAKFHENRMVRISFVDSAWNDPYSTCTEDDSIVGKGNCINLIELEKQASLTSATFRICMRFLSCNFLCLLLKRSLN